MGRTEKTKPWEPSKEAMVASELAYADMLRLVAEIKTRSWFCRDEIIEHPKRLVRYLKADRFWKPTLWIEVNEDGLVIGRSGWSMIDLTHMVLELLWREVATSGEGVDGAGSGRAGDSP